MSKIKSICFIAICLATPLYPQNGAPHPFYFTTQRIQTAKANIAGHSWAKELFVAIQASADEAAAMTDDELRAWFSEDTPISQCDCPNCNHHWQDYTWSWDKQQPDQLRCNYCGTIVSQARYPSNDTLNVFDPQGQIRPHLVYRDSTGKRFPIRQLIYYHKEQQAYQWIKNLGLAYAVTGKSIYAEKAVVLLQRFAEVYPSFGIHDNFRLERYPFGWAGKLRMWHYTDAYTLQDCAATYDAIFHSGAIDDKNKAFIEKQLFRTGLEFLTAVKPTQGITNDIPFRYAGVAMLGRTLQDHDAIAWVLDPEEGFEAFLLELFSNDGFWLERAASYHLMAVRPLPEIVEILQGYSDPPSFQSIDRFDNLDLRGCKQFPAIFSAMLDMRLPDGTLPSLNDSQTGTRPDPTPLEALYNWTGDRRWLQKANQAAQGKLAESGTLYSLFNRNPRIDDELRGLASHSGIPDSSANFPGMGLFMLRRGTGPKQLVFAMHHPKYTTPHTHYSALSTILYADGREMLSDFGYPSFSTDLRMRWYVTTLSHNTLTVDTRTQYAPYSVANWLHHGDRFSACEAEAWEAYRHICEPYFRQIALVDAPDGRVYAVDIFRAQGGSVHDWALHGESETLDVQSVQQQPTIKLEGHDYAYAYLRDCESGTTCENWEAEWCWSDGARLAGHFPGQSDCEIIKSQTPGERLKSMHGRKKPSLIARRRGENLRSEFIGVYEPHRGEPLVLKVEKKVASPHADWAVVLKVYRQDEIDYILSSYLDLSPQMEPFRDGNITIAWQSRFGVVTVKKGRIAAQEWIKGEMEGFRHSF